MTIKGMKKILVTGGAGYIGYHLVKKLLKKGYFVRILDSLIFGDESLQEFKENPNFELVVGDIRHIEDLVVGVKNIDAVCHLAAIVGDSACGLNPDATRTVNYEATKALTETCKYYKVKRVIFASSCSVYGASKEITLNEGSFLNPVSLYAETRIESEKVILKEINNATKVILRMATAFGYSKRMRFDLAINILVARALTEGKITIYGGGQYRPFVHAEDAAEAFIYCLEAPREFVDNQIFNVGANENNYKIADLGRLVSKYIPKTELEHIEHKEDDRNYRVSFDKLSHLLKYRVKRSVEDGIMEVKEKIENGNIKNWQDSKYYNSDYEYK